MSGILYIISAPSGSGKSTLVSEMRKFVPKLEFSISYTTRSPRGSEQNGREYYFITNAEFEEMLARGEFLEHAKVFDNYYGTAKSVLAQASRRGNDVLLDIDVQGERQVKEKMPEAVSIFVLPPSRVELESRLRKRSLSENVRSEETIRQRLDRARKEIENYPNYDYILVNDRLEQSVDELQAIVLSERNQRSGKPPSPEDRRYLETAMKCLKSNMEDKIKDILATFCDVSSSTAK
ncbi:MAG TPA: guanylate kinase [Candidatus Angelobacter sp.]|jgi:guanylate kinase|nr:guanylate kinase [Candidatus Angelobacter sp.]